MNKTLKIYSYPISSSTSTTHSSKYFQKIMKVKELAAKEIADITHNLNDQDRRDFVLKHVIEMAHDDDNEDNRIVAVQMFSSMSECFGPSLCEQFIGLELLSLGEDINYKVRK